MHIADLARVPLLDIWTVKMYTGKHKHDDTHTQKDRRVKGYILLALVVFFAWVIARRMRFEREDKQRGQISK